MNIELAVTPKQKKFIDCGCDEVLFGGAAGGGKSYGQLIDALLFALRYKGSRQLILRRTFPELERSLILNSLSLFPRELANYSSTMKKWTFRGGSVIEFGCCDGEKDVFRYQGAEYDIVRFDELTHFTETQYTYLISRIRGTNGFPKQIKSTANPGGVGHSWVKARFIEGKTADKIHTDEHGRSVIFIPSFVGENAFLMGADPDYVKRLEQLPDKEKKALLYGDWDIFSGQVFTEWRNNPEGYASRRFSHVITPFEIPREWRRYRAFDFGYSKPFAVLWFAVDSDGRAFCYRELYGCTGEPDVGVKWNVGQIAGKIREIEEKFESGQKIVGIADPAIWNATGSYEGSVADMLERNGVYFERGKNDRIAGKMQLHNRLCFDSEGYSMLYFFENCRNTIRTLPQLVYDSTNPEDVDTKGEDHLYDALKYFLMSNPIRMRISATNIGIRD